MHRRWWDAKSSIRNHHSQKGLIAIDGLSLNEAKGSVAMNSLIQSPDEARYPLRGVLLPSRGGSSCVAT